MRTCVNSPGAALHCASVTGLLKAVRATARFGVFSSTMASMTCPIYDVFASCAIRRCNSMERGEAFLANFKRKLPVHLRRGSAFARREGEHERVVERTCSTSASVCAKSSSVSPGSRTRSRS